MKSELTNNWIVCRVCLKQPAEEMRMIFDQNDEKDLTLSILRCGGVPIKRFDHYPDKICSKCLRYLRLAQKFRQTCQRSHQHLSKFIAPVVIDPSRLVDIVDSDLSLELEVVPALSLKLEPSDEIVSESPERQIKQEILHDEEEDIVDMYEPMAADLDAEEIQKIDRNVEGSMFPDNEYEFLEEITDVVTSSDDEYEIVAKLANKSPKALSANANKTTTNKILSNSSIVEHTMQLSSGTPQADQVRINTFRQNKFKQLKKCQDPMASVNRSGKSIKKQPKKSPKETSYICDICGNIYPSQSRLTEHIKLHKGIKPHDCE